MRQKPIIIAGFGRSGTTWLSDIISKSLGGLILFEPCHPSIAERSLEWSYREELSANESLRFREFIASVLMGKHQNPWLLRNHLGHDPLSFEPSFIDSLWANCTIAGYKTIRWNHLLENQVKFLDADLLYIIRHPLAVLASQRRRTRFWEEYGWKAHEQMIKDRVFHSSHVPIELKESAIASIGDPLSTICWFWALSQCIALHQLESMARSPIFYEALYVSPFDEAKKILSSIGVDNTSLHPSYLFTPSMQTLKTLHGHKEWSVSEFPSFFWSSTLTNTDIEKIYDILQKVGKLMPRFLRMMNQGNYW